MRHESDQGFAEVVQAAVNAVTAAGEAEQSRRDLVRRALGPALLARVTDLKLWLAPENPYPVRLHPECTARDAVWLEPLGERLFDRAAAFAKGLDLTSDRWIGKSRSRVSKLCEEIAVIQGLLLELACYNDAVKGLSQSPLSEIRAGLTACVRMAAHALAVSSAADPENLQASIDGFVESTHDAVRHGETTRIAWYEAGEPSLEAIVGFCFGIRSARFTRRSKDPMDLVAGLRRRDPFAPSNYQPSPIFSEPPPKRSALGHGDRLMVFAERQLRFVGFPAGPVPGYVVIGHMREALRLATTPFPAMAHIAAARTARLTIAALDRDRTAVIDRLSEFAAEDAHRIMQLAPRAEARLTRIARDPLEALTAYRSLSESAARGFLRLLLDLFDMSRGEPPRQLRADVTIATLVNQVDAAAKSEVLFQQLSEPLSPALRNAEAHEDAILAIDGTIQVRRAGEPVFRIHPQEVTARFMRMRSGFAGVDVGIGVLIHALTPFLASPPPESANPATVELLAHTWRALHDLPRVVAVRADDSVLTIETESAWDGVECTRFAHAFRATVLAEVQAVMFVSQAGEQTLVELKDASWDELGMDCF